MGRVLLIAAMGESLTDRTTTNSSTDCSGSCSRCVSSLNRARSLAGRRGGKSRAISVLATYLAGLCHHPSLVRCETGVLLCVAQDQRQADIVLDYIEANFRQSPILHQLIEQRT